MIMHGRKSLAINNHRMIQIVGVYICSVHNKVDFMVSLLIMRFGIWIPLGHYYSCIRSEMSYDGMGT